MKKIVLLVSCLPFILNSCKSENISADAAPMLKTESLTTAGTIIPGKFIVVLKNETALKGMPNAVRDKVLALLTKNGANSNAIDHIYSSALQGFAGTFSATQIQKMKSDPNVLYIEADQEVSISQTKSVTAAVSQPAQEIPWGITRVGSFGDGTGKTAWIIDTGIDLTHPDLNVDATRGFSAFKGGADRGFNDGNGHGSHVAGTVAAKNNAIGVVGVAANAKVVPVKVLSSTGSGSNSGVIAGIDWVAKYGVAGDAANMSLGGGISTALDQAVLNAASKGVKFALAAGNETDNANNHSPARLNGANIFTISAHDINNNFASFSNYANPPIDFCAPGVSIKSTWKGNAYNTISGTSMATPHVCGLLLLGPINSGGTVNNDRDTTPDILAHR
jgi:subtilisin family serine protease